MSTNDTRLDRLLPGLTAKERALLMLRDFKADKDQDRQLLNTAPERQTDELNRLIGEMNAANGDLAHVIVIILERARQEELRFSFLVWARICALELWTVGAYLNTSGSEPITESEYRQREQEARAEFIELEECATILTEDHHVWAEADYEVDEEGDRSPTDDAWYRARGHHEKELRALVSAGTLAAKGKGRRTKIAAGSFYDWLGKPTPVVPDLGIQFDVRPDDCAEQVARARRDHAFIQELLGRGACKLDLPLDMGSPPALGRPPGRFGVELARILASRIREGVQANWRELRAIEEQLDGIGEDFAGEDPLHDWVRASMDEANAVLTDLHNRLQAYTGPFELSEPDEELRDLVQHVVDNEVKHVPMR